MLLSLLSASDIQTSLCEWLMSQRKSSKFSRKELALRSTVPASTIKKFETTEQISLRQFLLPWQSVDDLKRLNDLTKIESQVNNAPLSIDDVLKR